eukprot:jgi/Chlat1/7471/Chrsp6S07476
MSVTSAAEPAVAADESQQRANPASSVAAKTEVNWDKLDKQKFFVVGTALFTGLSAVLYPITVVKTRMQVLNGDGLQPRSTSTLRTVQQIARIEGAAGFYKGFTTVIMGSIPARVVYLSILEVMKDVVGKLMPPGINEVTSAGITNAVAGLTSSMATQLVVVPVDVVSQRLMVQGGVGGTQAKYLGGSHAFRTILRHEGIPGLYRGFGASLITYAPSSSVWWGAYGASQRGIWRLLYSAGWSETESPSRSAVVAVQTSASLCAGACSAFVTNPLDVIKTRLQVLEMAHGQKPTFFQTGRDLIKQEGLKGLTRGLGPRWASSSLWGTAMITTYEFLKRIAAKGD